MSVYFINKKYANNEVNANDKYFQSAHHLNVYKTQFFYEN